MRSYATKNKLMAGLKLNEALDDLPVGVVILAAPKGEVVYVNKRAIELYGVDPRGLEIPNHSTRALRILTPDGSIFPPEQLPASRALLHGESVRNVELILEQPSLKRIIVSATTVPLRDNEGRVIGALGVFEDTSEHKEAEEALIKAASFPEANPNPIIEIDLDGKIAYCNPAAKSLFPDIDNLGLAHPFIADLQNIRETIIQDSGRHKREVKANEHYYYQELVPIRNSILRIYSIDITERKQAQEKLEEYSKNLENIVEERTRQLKEAERLAAIGATAGMVGHDIRNPLQAMTGDIYLLKDYLRTMPDIPMKQDVADSLEELDKNIGYINKIVADLQDYAKPIRPEISDVNLYELTTSVFQPINLLDSIKCSLDIEPDFWFKSDKTLLRRILTNLIINALQAMPNGGALTISACPHNDDRVLIIVEDTGVGIPEAFKPKLFTPMMTSKSKGQGLGLAVAKKLVDALKGTIGFESEEGKGTKFTIELPLYPSC